MAIGLNSYVTPGSSDGIAALAVSVYDTLLSSGVIAPAPIGVVRR